MKRIFSIGTACLMLGMWLALPVLRPPEAEAAYTYTNTFAYDAAGRLIRVNYDKARSLSYGYDRMGNITSVIRSPYLPPAGDMDGNEVVDLSDCIIALRVLTRLATTAEPWGDVDSDRRVGLPEVVYILQHVAGAR